MMDQFFIYSTLGLMLIFVVIGAYLMSRSKQRTVPGPPPTGYNELLEYVTQFRGRGLLNVKWTGVGNSEHESLVTATGFRIWIRNKLMTHGAITIKSITPTDQGKQNERDI